jgi:GT2 family glycosyltransferase
MVQTGNKGLRGKSIDIAQTKEPYVYYFTPSSMEKNLGEAYNRYMSLIPRDEDYGCLMDGDIMITDSGWDEFIRKVLKENPDGGMFTCMTNRIMNKQQLIGGNLNEDDSLLKLSKIAIERKKKFGTKVEKATAPISGLMMIVKKSIWNEFRFKEEGILGVDNDFHNRVAKKYPVYIMQGMYIPHFYRMDKSTTNKDHLK